jgi:hypothetical protein
LPSIDKMSSDDDHDDENLLGVGRKGRGAGKIWTFLCEFNSEPDFRGWATDQNQIIVLVTHKQQGTLTTNVPSQIVKKYTE